MDRRIDAVIVSYNSRDTLRECVAPLARLADVSVTVVDNASPDDSLEVVADLPVRAIQSGRNGGFGFGCNLGAGAGEHPYVLFLNPDARTRAEDLDRLLDVLAADPQVALVGPRLVDDDGVVMPNQRRFQRAASLWAQALMLHRLLPGAAWANEMDTRPSSYASPSRPEWVSGAAMLVRRSALAEIGGFDEEYWLYAEDMDLCTRLRARGHAIAYEPGATVHHIGGHSAPRSGLLAVMARSRLIYGRKHAGPLGALAQRVGIALDAFTHMLFHLGRSPEYVRGYASALGAALRPGSG